MNSHDIFDPVALLDSLAPPPGWNERTDLDADPTAARILARVLGGNVVPFRSPRRRLRIVTGVIIGVTLGGAAVAALWERSPDEARALTCWSAPDADPDDQLLAAWDGVANPVETCAQAWDSSTHGIFGPPDEIRVCVNDTGVATVIRGANAETCDRLGMSAYAPIALSGDDDALAIAEAQRELDQRFNSDKCATPAEAINGTREILKEFSLDGWEVKIRRDFTATEHCATVALEDTEHIAYVSPVAGPQTPTGSLEESVADAAEILDALFNKEICAAAQDAAVGTRDVLNDHGLAGWAVNIDSTDRADEQCARVTLDIGTETAHVSAWGPAD